MDGQNPAGPVRLYGMVVVVVGVLFAVAGVATWITVSTTLGDQQITVASDADMFAGQHVDQPWEAYAQASIIATHASEIAGGKTYAELAQDDPNRDTVMTASFLQASLFTSVVAFGVALMATVLGIVLVLLGLGMRRLARAATT